MSCRCLGEEPSRREQPCEGGSSGSACLRTERRSVRLEGSGKGKSRTGGIREVMGPGVHRALKGPWELWLWP